MGESEWLAERFEEHRPHLRAVAYRMLGSLSEADDAVQDAWLRFSRADTSDVENLRRMADDGRRAGEPEHAALTQVAARGIARGAHARPRREPGGRDRPRARGAARRLGRAGAARRARARSHPPSGSRSSCMTCSPCPSTRSRRSWTGRPRRHGSSRAAPVAAFRARGRFPTPTSRDSARSSTPSSPRRATAISTVSSPSWTPTSCSEPMAGRNRAEATRVIRGAATVAGQALAFSQPGLRVRPALVNGAPGVVTSWTDGHSPSSASPSWAEGSSRSTSSRTPRACASST